MKMNLDPRAFYVLTGVVVAVGAAEDSLVPAAAGAGAALLLVVLLGILLHRPLMRVPENNLKFGVGIILSSFGIFWFAKGSGFMWPGDDLAIPGLMTVILIMALLCVKVISRRK